MSIKVNKGTLATKVKISEGGKAKTVLHEEEETKALGTSVSDGQAVAIVKAGTFVRISRNFQTVEVQVGYEFPVPVRPGNEDDLAGLAKWSAKVESMVEDRVAEKISDAEDVLRTLSKK
jgi:hypothetical protein